MATPRKAISAKDRETLLAEYNHLCAMCGSTNPHIHHIDQNHDNNDVFNLIPLCPNCHLRDQHNPTRSFESGILRLFRLYKDPAILSPQFKPLYDRFKFIFSVENNINDTREIELSTKELVEFVAALNMGTFYSNKLAKLIIKPPFAGMIPIGHPDPEFTRKLIERNQAYIQKLMNDRDSITGLIIELLRYQSWHYTP